MVHRDWQLEWPVPLGDRSDRCTGFTRDAKYEADRSATPLTLPQIRELLIDHYEKLDSDARALIPLRRVYLPVPG
jgi:predicted Mrr-cat superfamily restriction endonuclease